ncbi:MAG TPA: efflux RND transporter periplasmic adaptor subunit [Candidatus Eisenbacteria bacterium]|nr:efflux RND transporter periplasmic adaptor subunit [Candidatus Eisenbacteria bacterium]
MIIAKALRAILILAAAVGIFAAGYFSGLRGVGREVPAAPKGSESAKPEGKENSTGMAGMPGMEGMQGMGGMAPGTIMLSPQKQQLLGVRTAVVERKPLTKTVRTVGVIAYDETRVTRVHSKIEGWIEKLYVNYTGKQVEKGQPLFTIYSPELLATQQEYLLAVKARERFSTSSIPEVRAGGESLVEASKRRLALWDISEKQIRELEERGEAQRALTLYAPHSGFVIKKEAYEGMRIMPDKELYTIADLSTVWVIVDIYESEIPFVRPGQRASVSLSYDPSAAFNGKVSYIYPYLDEKTRTAKVRLELPNPGFRLKPDMYVNAEIKIDRGRHLAIPEEAVLDSGVRRVVFIDKGNGHFEPKEVKLGAKMDGHYQVLDGVDEGQRIAASSAFLLDSESRLAEAMGAMAGMPGMSMDGMAGMQGMEGMKGMEGMRGMKMDAPSKAGPQEKKAGDLTLTFSTEPQKPKAGENVLRLKITDKLGNLVKDAQVSFQYTMNMPGMILAKADAKLSKDGVYETKANMGMAGEWDVTVIVRRPGQKEIQEKFKLTAG